MKFPARMSFEDCLREAERSTRRQARAARRVVPPAPRRRDAYKGAEFNRLTADWTISILTPDEIMKSSVRRLRDRARALERNNAYTRGYLAMVGLNVIGPTGVKFQGKVRNNSGDLNRNINDKLEDSWKKWARRVTIDGRQSLTGFSQTTLRSVMRDGEAFVRLWQGYDNRWGFALEPIDPDQVDETYHRAPRNGENEIRLGIEIDAWTRPVAFHVWNRPEAFGSSTIPRERIRIPASEVLHLYLPERANQTRGVTAFTAVMVTKQMLGGYTEAELTSSRAGSAKMGFWTRKADTIAGEVATDPNSDTPGVMTLEAAPGTIDFAPEGYDFSPWNPDHPSTAFQAFVKTMLREVATGLGVSYPSLANDLESVNYSSMRSGLLLERETWRGLQEWWIGSFLEPVYERWLNTSLLAGALVLDSRDFRKFLDVKFTARGWPWVDPLKDTNAGLAAISGGLDSRTRLLSEQGLDFEEVLEELAEEQKLAEEYDVSIVPAPAGAAPASTTDPASDPNAEDPAASEDAGAASGNGNGNGNGNAATLVAARKVPIDRRRRRF